MKLYPKALAKKQNLTALTICLVLLLYIGFLIISNYQSQIDLQETALEKWGQDTEKFAISVSYFFAERKSDLKNLSESRALGIYFENKALGMSMAYGLKASLDAVSYRFNQIMEEKKLGGKKIYLRITFASPNGELLVDTGPTDLEQDQGRNWNEFFTPNNRDVTFVDDDNPQVPMIIVTVPYFFKGTFRGQIFAWINLKDICKYFFKNTAKTNEFTGFISMRDQLYQANVTPSHLSSLNLHVLTSLDMEKVSRLEMIDQAGIKRNVIAIRVSIKGTPLTMTRVLPACDILGHRSPVSLLIAMGVLLIAVTAGMIAFWRATIKNLVLEARFEEAAKRQHEIEEKNRQLKQEITERRKVEGALQKSEARYRTLYEGISDAVFVHEVSDDGSMGSFIEVNDEACRRLGYTIDELLKMSPLDLDAADSGVDASSIVKKLAKGITVNFEQIHVAKDGRCIPVEIRANPLEMEGRAVVMSIVRDITERKQAENALRKAHEELERRVEERTDKLARVNEQLLKEIDERKQIEKALRESEEKHRTFLDANPDPVVVYDMEDEIVYVNPAFTHVFGWTFEECLGRKKDFFVPEEDRAEYNMIINKILAGDTIIGFETRRNTKKGDIVQVSLSGAVFKGKDGNPLGRINNLRDISEQKKLEAQLHRAQKMEAIGMLAGGVAHDLNNVLSGIVTYPDVLLTKLPQDSPLIKPIVTMKNSGRKAAHIVQDLLTLARRGVDAEAVVNLNYIILEYLQSPEHEKLKLYHPDVEVETRLESGLLNILGSSVHLSKAFMNLVSNAAEAMPNGGKISISTENRYIDRDIDGYDPLKEGDYITLKVSDTGTGISSDDIRKIFEPFYTKKVMGRSGTGLGMAVVWNTVKDHKGYIDVQSTEGKGTTFTIYFPATRQEINREKGMLSMDHYMGKGESILVVDDVKEQREILSYLLTALDYEVHIVSNGEEAVEYLKKRSVDLMVLDMIMDPGIDGLDTYKKILELHPGQRAIIASGFSETDRVKEAQRLGAGAYLKKPYTLEKIGIAVKTELGK